MLLLMAASSAANASHWLPFAVCAETVRKFYSASTAAVAFTSSLYMAAYLLLVIPASWFIDSKGVRASLLLGLLGTATGAWLKALACAPDRFALALTGQALVAASQVLTLALPARLSALWFPARQAASATALGVLGNQVGVAVGFAVPPLVVQGGTVADTSYQLLLLHIGLATPPTLLFLLSFPLFEAAPSVPPEASPEAPHPLPSPEEEPLKEKVTEPPTQSPPPQPSGDSGGSKGNPGGGKAFVASLRRLATLKDFRLLWAAYGLLVGASYAVATLLSPMLHNHFEGAEEAAGRVGLLMVAAGVLGSVAGGLVLDRWRRFKATTAVAVALALLSLGAFALTLRAAILPALAASAAAFGFFTSGFVGSGYAFAAALAPSVAESTSSGALNAASELFGLALTLASGEILDRWGDRAANLELATALGVALLLASLIRDPPLAASTGAAAPAVVRPESPPHAEKFLS